MILLDTGTPGTSREIYSEDADGEIRTRNSSQLQLRNDKYIMMTIKMFFEIIGIIQNTNKNYIFSSAIISPD